ncbi:MAG TPA: hypothetical protein VIJ04_17040 [Xanthobacteraceae bacterium]
MNEYAIEVIRNGQSIMSFGLDADGVIEIIRALHTAAPREIPEHSTQPERELEPQKRGPKGKKVKGCSVCGKPGHNKITCPERDKDEEPSDKRRFFMPRDKFDRVKLSVTDPRHPCGRYLPRTACAARRGQQGHHGQEL